MYKLIAMDMDGTLLKDDKTISEINKKSIIKAKELGVKIVLTTGRPIQGIKDYLNELGITGEDEYVIALNGALICKTIDYSTLNNYGTLTGKDLKYIYKKIKGLNTYVHAFTNGYDLVNKRSKFSDAEEKRINLKVKVLDFLKDVNDEDEILKVVLEEDKEILDIAAAKVPNELLEEYATHRSLDFMFEFMKKGCDKSTGIENLANYLGITKDEIIAIGDATNDKEMIEYAGLGVAMGNALDNIKEIADFVTKTNEEDGVAYVIEKFILTKNTNKIY